MSDKTIYNVAFGEEGADGKKHWRNCGILLKGFNDEGQERISIKLNSLPISATFDGWLGVFEKTDEPRKGKLSLATTDADVEF
jgi:hypothetical protein